MLVNKPMVNMKRKREEAFQRLDRIKYVNHGTLFAIINFSTLTASNERTKER